MRGGQFSTEIAESQPTSTAKFGFWFIIGSDGLSFDTTYSCSTAWGTRRTTTSPIADGAAWAEDCTCDYTCDAENEHTGATGGGFSFQPGPDG